MKLYELTGQYNALLSMVSDEAGFEAIQDTLEGLEGDITDKVENIVKVMASIEADEKAIHEEENRLQNRRLALENRRDSIKVYLESQMSQMGITKLKTPLHTVYIQKNPHSLRVTDETQFRVYAEEFYGIPQPVKIDKKAVLEALKSGAAIPGCELQQTESIRIR